VQRCFCWKIHPSPNTLLRNIRLCHFGEKYEEEEKKEEHVKEKEER
jgi:hypothetical protein